MLVILGVYIFIGETLHPRHHPMMLLAGPGGPVLGGLGRFLGNIFRPDLKNLVPPRVVCHGHVGQLRIYELGPSLPDQTQRGHSWGTAEAF
jgi:hypothetical protein